MVLQEHPGVPHGGHDQDLQQGKQPHEDFLRHQARVLLDFEGRVPGPKNNGVNHNQGELLIENKLTDYKLR